MEQVDVYPANIYILTTNNMCNHINIAIQIWFSLPKKIKQ